MRVGGKSGPKPGSCFSGWDVVMSVEAAGGDQRPISQKPIHPRGLSQEGPEIPQRARQEILHMCACMCLSTQMSSHAAGLRRAKSTNLYDLCVQTCVPMHVHTRTGAKGFCRDPLWACELMM